MDEPFGTLRSSWSTLRVFDAASESEDTSSSLDKPVRRWRAVSRLPKGFESSLARTSLRQRSNLITGSQEYRDSSGTGSLCSSWASTGSRNTWSLRYRHALLQ